MHVFVSWAILPGFCLVVEVLSLISIILILMLVLIDPSVITLILITLVSVFITALQWVFKELINNCCFQLL